MSILHDAQLESDTVVNRYVVERADRLDPPDWKAVAGPIESLETTVPDCCDAPAYFRLRLESKAAGSPP